MKTHFLAKPGQNVLARYGPTLAIYVVAAVITDAYFMGDTLRYVDSITAQIEGKYLNFWEFGHLFWRPLAYISYRVFYPLTHLVVGTDVRLNAAVVLIGLSWISGAFGAVILNALVRLFCKREWIVNVVTAAFITSNAFLNYLHSGCSYTLGLSFLLLGFYILLRDGNLTPSRASGVLAGACLALSVCFWFPYLLSLPAIFASPLILFGPSKGRLRLVVTSCLACAGVGFLGYASVAVFAIGIRDAAGLKVWYSDASHGLTNLGGFSRSLFGFARSLLNMGDEGRIFKRYVMHDPFNPVSLFDLFRLGLLKVGFFYAAMFSLVVNLFRSQDGRRILGLILLAAIPLFIFAIFLFDAGQIERYMPLYPFIFLAIAYVLCNERSFRSLKYLLLAYLVVMAAVDIKAMSKPSLESQKRAAEVRTRELGPLLKPESRVFTSHMQDEMVINYINFVFDPIKYNDQLAFVLDPNTAFILHWRQNFSQHVLSVWKNGGDVWLSKRLFSERPQSEWNWVEGDDPRVSWADLPVFFSQFETGESVGGDDGFVLLLPSPENEHLLIVFAQNSSE